MATKKFTIDVKMATKHSGKMPEWQQGGLSVAAHASPGGG